MGWKFLSYELNSSTPAYGNGDTITIEKSRSIARNGDTSNNSVLNLASHLGTHIDFPYHFSADGKKCSDYSADKFVYSNTVVIDISAENIRDFLIHPENLSKLVLNESCDLLILKTGFTSKRGSEAYWNYNWGFAPQSASFIKEKLPNVKCLLFDTISLTSFQDRPTGRIAHRSFLLENELLLVEDADLSEISENSHFETVIISPLRFDDCDGTPVTVLANEI